MRTGLPPEIGQEVDDQVEENGVEDLVWQIGKHRSESLGRRMVAGGKRYSCGGKGGLTKRIGHVFRQCFAEHTMSRFRGQHQRH